MNLIDFELKPKIRLNISIVWVFPIPFQLVVKHTLSHKKKKKENDSKNAFLLYLPDLA
jgi:hypothetical protein